MTIHVFGPLGDITGSSTLTMEGAGDTDQLRKQLEEAYPALKDRKYVIAVNKEVVRTCITLQEGSEVALLPPFSGG